MQKIRNLFKHEDGFTLIELLVVIAVLGILAAIAIPRLGGVTDKARQSEAKTTLGTVKNAMEMHFTEYGEYPTYSVGDEFDSADTTGSFTAIQDGDNIDSTDSDGIYEYINPGTIPEDWTLEYISGDTTTNYAFDMYQTDGDGNKILVVSISNGKISEGTASN